MRLRPTWRRLELHPQRQLVSPRIGDQHLGAAVGRFRIELVGGIADAKAHLGGLAVCVVGRQVQGGVGRQLQGARAVTRSYGGGSDCRPYSPTANMESNPDINMTSISNGHRLSLLLKNRSNYQFHALDKPEIDWLIQVIPGVFAQALNVTRVDLIKAIRNREAQIRSE